MAKNSDAIPYYRELREALDAPGCALCYLTVSSAVRYIDTLLWQMVNEPDVRAALNAARGYCNFHAWMLPRRGGALGVAILMHGITKTLLDATDQTPAKNRSAWDVLRRNANTLDPAQLADALEPQAPCPICAHVQGMEHDVIITLLDQLADDDALAAQFRASEGLCLDHFRRALRHAQPRQNTDLLIELQRAVWQRTYGELGEFIRKNDHRFRGETFTPAETDAWERALALISGPSSAAGTESQGLTQVLKRGGVKRDA